MEVAIFTAMWACMIVVEVLLAAVVSVLFIWVYIKVFKARKRKEPPMIG